MSINRNVAVFFGLMLLALIVFYYFFVLKPVYENSEIGQILEENGFVEFRPPSNIVSPGAWVKVLNSKPMQLGVICSAKNAIGLEGEGELISSISANSQLKTKLSGNFSVNVDALENINAKIGQKSIKNISFLLNNIKLLEVADDVVLAGIGKRDPHCQTAIKNRIGNNEIVSMVKSALIADVEYKVDFETDLDAEAKAKIVKEIAGELNVSVDETGSLAIVGRQLVWGIRDDVVLAKAGLGLPNTGGNVDRSVLDGSGPVAAIRLDEQARNTFDDKPIRLSFKLTPIKQQSSMSCWASVYTMMKSWRDQKDWEVSSAVASLGDRYVKYLERNEGLPGGKENEFVRAAGMLAEPPASYKLSYYHRLLSEHGPIWIIVGDGISSHALLMVGMYADSLEETAAAYEGTMFEFIDPASGIYTYNNGMSFAQEFEREAVFVVNNNLANTELRWQILRWI